MDQQYPKRQILSLLMLSIGITLSGCATFDDRPPGPRVVEVPALEYQVKRGDTLAGIATRLTGNIENWQTIAQFNRLGDPTLIRAGSMLLIPSHLLTNSSAAATPRPAPSAPATPPKVFVAQSSPESVAFQPTAVPGAPVTPVATVPVKVNRQFDIAREVDSSEVASKTDSSENDSVLPGQDGRVRIQVVGTYYPKGVYAQPFNHSPLIMRAPPGAIFELDQDLGEWLRIKTKQGAGYIRARDAKLSGAAFARTTESDANT